MLDRREREVAWAGGLFEGEGSFVLSVYRTKTTKSGRVYQNAQASVSMCDLDPLERFYAAVGMGRMNGPYVPKKENHRPFWRWTIAGKEGVINLLVLLEPFLSDRRVSRAIEVITADNSGRPLPSRRENIPGRALRKPAPEACPHGHAYDELNTYITPSGRHQCRACKRACELARGRRLRAEAGIAPRVAA